MKNEQNLNIGITKKFNYNFKLKRVCQRVIVRCIQLFANIKQIEKTNNTYEDTQSTKTIHIEN